MIGLRRAVPPEDTTVRNLELRQRETTGVVPAQVLRAEEVVRQVRDQLLWNYDTLDDRIFTEEECPVSGATCSVDPRNHIAEARIERRVKTRLSDTSTDVGLLDEANIPVTADFTFHNEAQTRWGVLVNRLQVVLVVVREVVGACWAL